MPNRREFFATLGALVAAPKVKPAEICPDCLKHTELMGCGHSHSGYACFCFVNRCEPPIFQECPRYPITSKRRVTGIECQGAPIKVYVAHQISDITGVLYNLQIGDVIDYPDYLIAEVYSGKPCEAHVYWELL